MKGNQRHFFKLWLICSLPIHTRENVCIWEEGKPEIQNMFNIQVLQI